MDASPPQPSVNHHNTYQHAPDGGIWPNGPVQLARGRQPRDANAKTVSYTVSSLDEFETSLREYLHNPPDEPEHTECQLSFWIGTSFVVSAPKKQHQPQQQQQRHHHPQPQTQPQPQQQPQPPPPPGQHPPPPQSQPPPPSQPAPGQPPQPHLPHAPPGYQPANGLPAQYGAPSHAYPSVTDPAMAMPLSQFPQHNNPDETSPVSATNKKPEPKVSLSVLEALQPTADPKVKMRNQRAIAKCCVDSIQKVDGYRYSFHNCWNSREDDSFRFSYYCNDSLLNKDRAANGKGAKFGKRATKPVYDCKGVLSVKFSAKKSTLDVFYKHIPLHKTYEERAPPPRKDSKRRKFLEENDPDALVRIANRPKPTKQEFPEPNAPPKPKKKKLKPDDDTRPATNSIESDLRAQSLRSLLELIQVDPPAPEPAAPEPPPLPPPQPPPQPTINPEPVIQQPPPPPPPQPPPPRKRPRNSCDICKAKKTKCDGTRPVCKTCTDKKRQCLYSDNSVIDDRRQSIPIPVDTTETVRQAQAANHELSELEKMKRELEEAKARIQELEAEKRGSSTPSQTPTMTSRPQSQPQPPAQPQRHQPPPPQAQPQSQPQPGQQQRQQVQQLQQQQQQQQQQVQQQQRQQHVQHQQLNQHSQTNQHTPHVQNSQQQLAYKIDSDTSQPQLQTTQQLQAPQYFASPTNHNPYGLNRPIPPNQMAQNTMSPQAQPNLSQPQATHQMHASSTGLTPTAETTNPYGRQFEWSAAYYGYQSAQQHPQDQWAAARNPGVFR